MQISTLSVLSLIIIVGLVLDEEKIVTVAFSSHRFFFWSSLVLTWKLLPQVREKWGWWELLSMTLALHQQVVPSLWEHTMCFNPSVFQNNGLGSPGVYWTTSVSAAECDWFLNKTQASVFQKTSSELCCTDSMLSSFHEGKEYLTYLMCTASRWKQCLEEKKPEEKATLRWIIRWIIEKYDLSEN